MIGEDDAVKVIGLALVPARCRKTEIAVGTGVASSVSTFTRMRRFFVSESR